MICPKCGSENVNVQVVSETSLYKKKKGVLWWLLVGWWWWIVDLCLWIFMTIPRLIVQILKPTHYATKTEHQSMCVCQNCGYSWRV